METPSDSKTCRDCAESIRAAATVCPYCGRDQRKGFFTVPKPPRHSKGLSKTMLTMSEGTESKPCAWCAEPIRVAAKACPYCRRLQPKWKWISEFLVVLPLVGFALLCFVGALWLKQLFSPGRDFEPFRDQIVVEGSNMHFGQATNGNFVSAIGMIRNNSPYAWKEIQLEVQYYDKDGRMIDTRSESRFGDVLPPGATQAFRLRTQADKPQSAYADHKVFLRSAKDSRKWP